MRVYYNEIDATAAHVLRHLIAEGVIASGTKPGLRLLVNGIPGRVGLWRIAGNAINPVLAAEVLGALLDCERLAA